MASQESYEEICLECSDGIRLAAHSYKSHRLPSSSLDKSEDIRILCLHGWMDNCRSFHLLAPGLVSQLNDFVNVHVVALDLPGHGMSSHRSLDAPPMLRPEYLFYIAETVRLLKWSKFVLIGHSMSAAISVLYAAAFPEQVRNLVLLDSVGNLERPLETVSQNLRSYVQSRQASTANQPQYTSFDAVIQARVRSVIEFPGKQHISIEAAQALCQRGVAEEDGVFTPLHDPRLLWGSIQYFSNQQIEALYRDVQCPTCVLLGEDGWPINEGRKNQLREHLKPSILARLPGSHYLHADPDTADRVVKEIVAFLRQSSSS